MTMPMHLVLVRHGQSEGNAAHQHSREGDNSLHTDEFRSRHHSSWRLTDGGIRQAKIAGAWIRNNVYNGLFDRHYVSGCLRAVETAALLDLPNACWRKEDTLIERDWGDLDRMTEDDRWKFYRKNLEDRQVAPLFWKPPNGESVASLGPTRVFRFLDTMHRECTEMRVIVVLHGDLMWAFRIALEHMPSERYTELDRSNDPRDHIHNCQIIHYTRMDPDTCCPTPNYRWVRSVCPTDLSKSRNVWERIERVTYSNADLLALAEKTPRLISG
jgi:NAD+ kinase